jgi:PIN domain
MFAALLDTSVLWPSLQRDFLLSLAVEGLYRPLWSTAILDELRYHEAQKLIGGGLDPVLAAHRSQHLVDRMSAAFDDAIVVNWESLEGTFGLPDVDDEHVVAAALVGGAEQFERFSTATDAQTTCGDLTGAVRCRHCGGVPRCRQSRGVLWLADLFGLRPLSTRSSNTSSHATP